MRQGQQHRRGRGRNNNGGGGNQNRKGQHHQNPLMRTYQSNGPDHKIHGTPAQIAEKYMSLARDALSSGDHVLAENYLQHAEHYNRIILTYREQQGQQGGENMNGMPRHRPFPGPGEPFEAAGEMGEDGQDEAAGDQPQIGMRPNEPQPRMFDPGQMRGDDRPRHQSEHQQFRDQGQGQGQRDPRDGGGRDRDQRDNRNFRPRHGQQPRFGQERMDRGNDPRADRQDRFSRGDGNERQERFPRGDNPERQDRGERQDRFPRNEGGERGERPERHDRPERQDRPDRQERPERQDRGERFERERDRGDRQERGPRPQYVERNEPIDRPIAAPPVAVERPIEPAPIVVPLPEAAAPAPVRRRERVVDPGADQPEFLRRPVRRPRRDAAAAAAENGDPAPVADRPAPSDRSGSE